MRNCARLFASVALLLGTACDGPVETPQLEELGIEPTSVAQPPAKEPLPNWADEDLSWLSGSSRSDYAESRAVCQGTLLAEPPEADFPPTEEAAALNGCSSADLYFGIGVARDRVKARHCALLEREEYRRMYVEDGIQPYPRLDGSGVLAMIYANGEGATRDFDVAIKMACEMSGAPAEMQYRLTDLAEKRSAGWEGNDFHACDHITSGLAGGRCQSLETRLARQTREEGYAKTTGNWPAEKRAAFETTIAAFSDYSDIANQMNCWRGTAAGMCSIAGSDDLLADFSSRLLAFAERAPLPTRPERGEFEQSYYSVSSAAVATDEEWKAVLEDLVIEEDYGWYENHRKEAIAARRAFEPKLIAFARIARADLTSTEVRRLFRDL